MKEVVVRRVARTALVGLWVLVMVAGCAETGQRSESDEFAETVEWALSYYENAFVKVDGVEASDAQLTQFDAIVARGDVVFEDVREAVERTFECFEDAGVPHASLQAVPASSAHTDYPMVSYSHGDVPGLSMEESLRLADACMYAESHLIEVLYQNTPGYIAERYLVVEDNRALIESCLADVGVVFDAGQERSASDLDDIAHQAFLDGLPISPCMVYFP